MSRTALPKFGDGDAHVAMLSVLRAIYFSDVQGKGGGVPPLGKVICDLAWVTCGGFSVKVRRTS